MKSTIIRKAVVAAGLAAMIGTGAASLASATASVGAPVQEKHHYTPPSNPVPCNLPPGSICIR